MKGPAEIAVEMDRLLDELGRVDRGLDGYVDDQGEQKAGALDVLAEAEDAWLEHKDAKLADLAEEYKGRQLPGDDKVDALTRGASSQARDAWNTYLHARRLVKRLERRFERLERQLSGRQTQSKLQVAEGGADRRGLPIHGQHRGSRAA